MPLLGWKSLGWKNKQKKSSGFKKLLDYCQIISIHPEGLLALPRAESWLGQKLDDQHDDANNP